MDIEHEIKQKAFKSVYHKVIVNLYYTANQFRGKENVVFKKHGLSAQQFNVLRILRGQYPHPCSLLTIRERMLDKDSNASRLVDKLVAAQLVDRNICPMDRRQVDICINERGLELLELINPLIDDLHKNELGLTEAEAIQLSNLLDKMRS